MQKKHIHISLYILIPIIFSGMSLLVVLMTFYIKDHLGLSGLEPTGELQLWALSVTVFTFVCSFLLTWLMLKPVTKFVKHAVNLPLFPKTSPEQEGVTTKADIQHYTRIFDQITTILGQVEAKELFPQIIGQSKSMREIFSQILKVAPTEATVLISGESGTGKELIATAIYEHSRRQGKPFIKLNCVAIPDGLLESELFGHEKGAFTGATGQKKGKFEQAHGGTIFLDEIGDMPASTQAKLLRVLQEKEFERIGGHQTIKVNVRFIAATNKNLTEMVKEGQFREDLFYRLNVFSLHLPPLRERREDIPLLVQYFLEKEPKAVQLSSEALQVLVGYNWPGNIRELRNTIERAGVMAENGLIKPGHLSGQIVDGFTGWALRDLPIAASLDERLREMEKSIIIEALSRVGGVQAKAAQLLGINQRSLWHRIKKLGIDVSAIKHLQNL